MNTPGSDFHTPPQLGPSSFVIPLPLRDGRMDGDVILGWCQTANAREQGHATSNSLLASREVLTRLGFERFAFRILPAHQAPSARTIEVWYHPKGAWVSTDTLLGNTTYFLTMQLDLGMVSGRFTPPSLTGAASRMSFRQPCGAAGISAEFGRSTATSFAEALFHIQLAGYALPFSKWRGDAIRMPGNFYDGLPEGEFLFHKLRARLPEDLAVHWTESSAPALPRISWETDALGHYLARCSSCAGIRYPSSQQTALLSHWDGVAREPWTAAWRPGLVKKTDLHEEAPSDRLTRWRATEEGPGGSSLLAALALHAAANPNDETARLQVLWLIEHLPIQEISHQATAKDASGRSLATHLLLVPLHRDGDTSSSAMRERLWEIAIAIIGRLDAASFFLASHDTFWQEVAATAHGVQPQNQAAFVRLLSRVDGELVPVTKGVDAVLRERMEQAAVRSSDAWDGLLSLLRHRHLAETIPALSTSTLRNRM